MSQKSALISVNSLDSQFWGSISESEAASWPSGTLDSVWAWASGQIVTIGDRDQITEIDVHDDTTIITVLSIDCPFIIDSLTALVQRQKFTIVGLVHPVLKSLDFARDLSLVSIRIQESLSAEEAALLGLSIEQVMQDVILATRDWRAMRATMESVLSSYTTDPKSNQEEADFLRYLIDGNFTFLGYGHTSPHKKMIEDGLGVLSSQRRSDLVDNPDLPLPVTAQKHHKNESMVVVFKLPIISNVHRPVRLDAVVIRLHNKRGEIEQEHIFIGLFTSVTYSRSIADVPLLRSKAAAIVAGSSFSEDHHDFKALSNILEKYPRDELFRIDLPTLKQFAYGIMRLQERQRIALFARQDSLTGSVFTLLYIPRDRYDSRLRAQIISILERELSAHIEGFTTTMDDSPLVRLLVTLRSDKKDLDVSQLEKTVLEETRPWAEYLRTLLSRDLAGRYEHVFPANYQTKYGTATIVQDVIKVEEVIKSKKIQIDLYRPSGYHANRMRFKIYAPDHAVPLSDVLPVLENFGFRVDSEQPFELMIPDNKKTVWMHDFSIRAQDEEAEYDIAALKPIFEEAFKAIWYNTATNDALNRLIARANMTVRQVMVLRSYARYLHQIRIPFSPSYVLATLGDYPCLSLSLVKLFEAMFDPNIDASQRSKIVADLHAEIDRGMGKVTSLDQDTIIRRTLNLITSTLRTNSYQLDKNGERKEYLSFKFDCAQITEMPAPRLKYEIFVMSGRFEGVHLRGGDVARGGIRWSDRLDDFRTEILGLVKAQMVKNAVIVPTGAKGGFVLKRPPQDRAALQIEGIECYKIFIRGLLDITDNRVDGRVVPPSNTVRYDGDDTYLVVAADKGTATFSDTANGLAQEYGFWLDDAFASGGSVGYDHKAVAITARGAWECIKRHFRERGKNIQTTPFTVVGIGDMAGDVFGNGMLLSPHIRLMGAFNHMHIFCDPTPDTTKTFAERKRLFDAVKGWGDYDTNLLSKGGRIFLRSEKAIELTPEIKAAFEIESDTVSPAELIQAMLKSNVELLYFGGIGTYIKDESESDADVSDKANDRLRVNAKDIRAHVIGEGANLGITQTARIILDKKGVRLNTDFIDNSGGVDCSDHEVNIKILLAQLGDQITIEDRNALLVSMTKSVCDLVLRNNYQQSLAISIIQNRAAELMPQHALTIDWLQREYGLNRRIENLPSEKEMEDRQSMGQGLTRPEIAILLSYSKMALLQEIINSDIPDRPHVLPWLETYFPDILREKYKDAIAKHPLRREIIATQIANSIVNRMGPHFVFVQQEQSGLSIATVVDAYLAGREILNLHSIWLSIESLDGDSDTVVQGRLFAKSIRALDRLIWRLLNIHGERLRNQDTPMRLKAQLDRVMPRLLSVLSDDLRSVYEQRMGQLKDQKIAKGVAEAVSMLPYAVMTCDALQLVPEGAPQAEIDRILETFFMIGARFKIDMLRAQARYLASEQPHVADALYGLVDSLWNAQIGLTQQVLQEKIKSASDACDHWMNAHIETMRSLQRTIDNVVEHNTLDLAQLVMIEQKIRMLAQRA